MLTFIFLNEYYIVFEIRVTHPHVLFIEFKKEFLYVQPMIFIYKSETNEEREMKKKIIKTTHAHVQRNSKDNENQSAKKNK